MTRSAPETTASRPLRWWDLVVTAVLLALALLGLTTGRADAAPADGVAASLWQLVPLAGFAVVYAGLGRRVLLREHREQPPGALGTVFLTLLVLVLGAAVLGEPMNASLQVLVYPLIWSTTSRYGAAVVWSALAAGAVSLGLYGHLTSSGSDGALVSALLSGPLAFAFAVAMGTWITRIFDRGERYRELAEQLRRSQRAVAALSEAAGASAERERLSRELHDTLTQTLTGLVMLSEQAARALDAGEIDRAQDRLARVTATARDAAAEARTLVATTHPLGDGGLEQAIARVATSLREDAGVRVECRVARLPLDRERQVVLLRAVQEGLANVRRHSGATEVTVSLERQGTEARLRVDDNGRGPSDALPSVVADATRSGFGLSGLRERVRLVGGDVRFGRLPGGGARLEVSVPLAPDPAEGDPA